jgi:hypothetical protein
MTREETLAVAAEMLEQLELINCILDEVIASLKEKYPE